jgi:uncharacterized protein (DUF486 family)
MFGLPGPSLREGAFFWFFADERGQGEKGPDVMDRFMNATTLTTVVLLVGSNVFMTFAWYGHLRYKSSPLALVILASWGIAFFEYCLQVPANRLGSTELSPAQLKIIQEVVTLVVFAVFSVAYLGQPLRWNYLGAAICMLGAVAFIFLG